MLNVISCARSSFRYPAPGWQKLRDRRTRSPTYASLSRIHVLSRFTQIQISPFCCENLQIRRFWRENLQTRVFCRQNLQMHVFFRKKLQTHGFCRENLQTRTQRNVLLDFLRWTKGCQLLPPCLTSIIFHCYVLGTTASLN